jgi:Arc/MetJ family transcription regulator
MRTTITLDDELLAKARSLTGIEGTSQLLKAALTAMIQRESAKRLILLGGSAPDMKDIPKRRFEPVETLDPKQEEVNA